MLENLFASRFTLLRGIGMLGLAAFDEAPGILDAPVLAGWRRRRRLAATARQALLQDRLKDGGASLAAAASLGTGMARFLGACKAAGLAIIRRRRLTASQAARQDILGVSGAALRVAALCDAASLHLFRAADADVLAARRGRRGRLAVVETRGKRFAVNDVAAVRAAAVLDAGSSSGLGLLLAERLAIRRRGRGLATLQANVQQFLRHGGAVFFTAASGKAEAIVSPSTLTTAEASTSAEEDCRSRRRSIMSSSRGLDTVGWDL
jgi:hypothetical protein